MNVTELINTKEVDFLCKDRYKCSHCGHERLVLPVPYEEQSQCPRCTSGQMMSWAWNGWKENEARKKKFKAEQLLREVEEALTVDQTGMDLKDFTEEELIIGKGLTTVDKLPFEAPWMNALGACSINIYAVRRRGDLVEFGIGNEKPPILSWISADDFPDEWSK